ncbi:MAG TPA: SEC-C metal-binding domain-containing protein [Nakamurella sp.]|jgi:hypothetical protein
MSWVTIDRVCEEESRSDPGIGRLLADSGRPLRSQAAGLSDEELLAKLRGFGLDLDRHSLDQMCEGALSAEAVAAPLIAGCGFGDDSERMQGDWIWICLVTLWQRWWPGRVCLELLDDKVQSGYREMERDEGAAAAIWLDAWSDLLRLCDAAGIGSIEEFDDRLPLTQSLYNWSQDLEDALWNAGLDDGSLLQARIAVCEEALRRFPNEDQLMIENRRRALAESYFEVGQTGRAEELFESWLAADQAWGYGWIGWASCHQPGPRRPGDYGRAEQLLRRGYATPGVRDRDAIAEWLQLSCQQTGRPREARDFGQQARRLRRREPPMTVSRTMELTDLDDDTSMLRDAVTVSFGGDGVPLAQLPGAVHAAVRVPGTRAAKVGRNAPCPCGSGKKFKKCCGGPVQPAGLGSDHAGETDHG